jgi:hypothetical protein
MIKLSILAVVPHLCPSAIKLGGNKTPRMSANASESGAEGKLAVIGASIADEVCQYCCIRLAEIFQVTGNYCIECWQELTYPNV